MHEGAGPNRDFTLRCAGLSGLCRQTGDTRPYAIALLDGRVTSQHPALCSARIHLRSPDAAASRRASRHALQVASILVGGSAATPELLGLCPGARLLNANVVDDAMLDGEIDAAACSERLADAIGWAARAEADVIVCGIEIVGAERAVWNPLWAAIAEAARHGVRTIIPLGNESGVRQGAAHAHGAIWVLAGDWNGLWSPRANIACAGGPVLAAPGFGIPVALPEGGCAAASGSSFAAAIVAGAFIVLRANSKGTPPDAVWRALLSVRRSTLHFATLDAGAAHRLLTSPQLEECA
ncbi:MAG: hypothetical protein E6G97_17645 [Alphaproteobacteria bacterium]|nr:MAG: hypothetical protein E6G97_17645 [Alphaproteobacteria bacterium]